MRADDLTRKGDARYVRFLFLVLLPIGVLIELLKLNK